MLEAFTATTFAPRIGESFRVRVDVDGDQALQVQLAEVQEGGEQAANAAASAGRRTPFSLVFRGPASPVLPQRIYRLEHPGIGAFDLFLVPIGPEAGAMRYEAVFG